ncbi:MAG: GntR family transcriptional regulator [Aestuariivirgaceae bacterium]
MNIQTIDFERRTVVDDVFERLRSDIVSLKLVPGTKLSEVEVAKQMDVSRQPVREAFIRLSNLKLLKIRPQKATVVRKISEREILNSRFIRTAIELEVVRKACKVAGQPYETEFAQNLARQLEAVNDLDAGRFHNLDYEFHGLICAVANCDFAYTTIAESKAHVDRLCMLSLSTKEGLQEIYDDHVKIHDRLKNKDEEGLVALTRLHLTRLDKTLAAARLAHEDYFED